MRKVSLAALLFLMNWYVCQKLFGIEYLRYMNSIEGAYISISRYAMQNWLDLSWWPLWYAGIPYQNTYPPLLHVLVAVFADWTGHSPALSYHAVNAFLYCLGPVMLYWMALRISGLPVYSFLAGLLYSLLTPSAFLIPHVREELGGLLHPRRLQTLVYYGDGPFVSALTLMPVTIVCLDLAVRKRKPLFYLLAAVAMASVVLTNWLGGAVLATAVLAYLLSTGFQRPAGVWVTVLGIALLSYVLASPWIPPSTLNTIRVNAQTIGGPYQMTWWNALYGVMLGAVAFVLYWILHRVKAPQYLHMSLYFLLFVGSITLSAEWADIYLLPQPHRYHLAMDMAICLNVAFLLKLLADRIPRWGRTVAMLVVLALSVGQAMRYHLFADDWIQSLDIRTTTEYKTARWFDGHMGGKRVMAPGSTSYYMNIFTDTPQLGGGFEQGDPNWVNRVALYIIYSGENAGPRDGEMSILWLKAFGVRAVAVGGPKSGEHYKPFRNPQKFAGLLPELWRDGDDYIYSVPCRSDSLAHVVRKSDLVDRAPRHGLDADGVRRYVAALEDPMLPQAEMHWINRHRARILATVAKGQVISAQVNYHAGWRAEVDGTAAEVHADKLGLIVIEPKCEGRCVVDLIYDGGIEMKVAQLFSLSSFLGCLIWTMIATRRRSLRP